MTNITKAVMHLIIANVLFFILATFVPVVQDTAALYYFEHPNFHWWQLFSHLFMHGSVTHLFFNMFALYSFGVPLESYFGSNRFVLFYFACGLGAGLLHTGVNYYEFHTALSHLEKGGFDPQEVYTLLKEGMYDTRWEGILSTDGFNDMMSAYMTRAVGASGAVYGILVAFGMLFPNAELMLMFLPIPIKAKYFTPILIGLDLFSGVTGFSIFGSNIAHFAHIGGALIGFVLMKYWQHNLFNDRRLY